MRRSPNRSSERGAVVVMVAVWLPVLALFVSFAVDFAHFFDYSRNLQNRADAAALAAGDAFGTTCFGSPTGTQLADIGHSAQQYAGPPNGTPSPGGTPNGTNLPYIFSSSTPYQNQPNLTQGQASNFFMILNGATSHDKGGTNFSDGNFCSTDYSNPAGPAVDVWLTQERLPLFFPLLGFQPNISAHARVQLQGEASNPFVRPIAVSDPGAFGCATVIFKNSQDNSTIATRDLTEIDTTNYVFDNATNPVSVQMPTGAYVYMQVFLSDCSGNGQTFDDTTNSGIEVINTYGMATPPSGEAPKITAGGITLSKTGATCNATSPGSDQYFSVGGCAVSVTAHVTFSPDVTNPNNQASITATDTSTGSSLNLNPDAAGTTWTPNGNQNLNIGDSTGQHLIRIDWSQKSGSVGGVTCTNQTPCRGTFGIQQQAFGACNGCDQPDDSGPVVKSQIRLDTDGAGTTGENAFLAGSTQNLVVTLQLAGIRSQQIGTGNPTILRFSGATNHQTGLIDCGQGNNFGGTGTPEDAYTIYGGCGPNNPFEPPQCASTGLTCALSLLDPLYVYARGNPVDCSPAVDPPNPLYYTGWPGGNHQDCVQTLPGTKRVGVVCGLLQRITDVAPADFQASSSACQSSIQGEICPANNWASGFIPVGDRRKIDVVLTAPVDLAAAAGSPAAWVPIRRFATFYVTGWDPSLKPNCTNNDPWPGPNGGKQTQNGAIWGHWMSDVEPGVPDPNNPCITNSIEPVICVPTLTR
jgi:putative Flp pilus-assembly TadE/G-like protein